MKNNYQRSRFLESVGESLPLCLCDRSLCLCGEIALEIIHHRDTEIAQRHGEATPVISN